MKNSEESKSTVEASATPAATAAKPAAKARAATTPRRAAKPAATPPEIANLPAVTTAEVETFVEAIDTFAELLGAGFVVPQPEDVRRMPKPRKEAPAIVPLVADLSRRYNVTSASYPSDVILAKQQLVTTLSPVAERIAAVQKLVGTIMMVGQSGAWEGSMVTYGLLKSEARGNAVLRSALVPLRDKLRPTYETEDGGKTKLRGRSKKSVTAKEAENAPATEAPSASASAASAPAAASEVAKA